MTKALLAAVLLCAACGDNDCDKALLSGTCDYRASDGGECVEFTGISTADSRSAKAACVNRGGLWAGAPDAGGPPCATAGQLGVCSIPNDAQNIDIGCSPGGTINAHFYAPFTPDGAQNFCHLVPDAGFTPG